MGLNLDTEHPECQTVAKRKRRKVNNKVLKDKRNWALIPWEPMVDVLKVMELGATKYGEDNWMQETDKKVYWSAIMRHMTKWIMGEKIDPETGLSHIAHAAAGALILAGLEK